VILRAIKTDVAPASSLPFATAHQLLPLNVLSIEALERRLSDLLDAHGPAVEASLLASGVDVEPELGGDDHLVAHGCQRLADQLLVGERP